MNIIKVIRSWFYFFFLFINFTNFIILFVFTSYSFSLVSYIFERITQFNFSLIFVDHFNLHINLNLSDNKNTLYKSNLDDYDHDNIYYDLKKREQFIYYKKQITNIFVILIIDDRRLNDEFSLSDYTTYFYRNKKKTIYLFLYREKS